MLKLVMVARKLYWWLLRPVTVGVRALIVNEDNAFLLVKHTYSDAWYLPGGQVEKNETLIEALKRELYQEVGISEIEEISLFNTYSNFYEFKSDYVSVFLVRSYSISTKTHFEIERANFFNIETLPKNISLGTKRRIEEFLKLRKVDYLW